MAYYRNKQLNFGYKILTFTILEICLMLTADAAMAVTRDLFAREAEEEAARLVVMLEGQHSEGTRFGAGIIIGYRDDSLFIATANHTVRWAGEEVQAIQIWMDGDDERAIEAKLLEQFDQKLDLAVMKVTGLPNLGVDPNTLPFDRLGNPEKLERGTMVVEMGYPNGRPWALNLTPDRIADRRGHRIYFESIFLAPGHSGGALFDEHLTIVGMIRADLPPHGEALSIKRIIEQMKDWGYPTQLGMPPEGLRFQSVATGEDHACILTESGIGYCFGTDANAKLGDGTYASSDRLRRVVGNHRFRKLSLGRDFSCGLRQDGRALCWGSNVFGELGDGSPNQWPYTKPAPVQVAGDLPFIDQNSGKFTSCALTKKGRPWCWGDLTRLHREPREVPTDLSFTSVYGADQGACGLTKDGEVFCWDLNSADPFSRKSPAKIPGTPRFKSIAIGSDYRIAGCGVDINGITLCWGTNDRGQLGNGRGGDVMTSANDSLTPVPVSTEVPFRAVTVGEYHACGLGPNGKVWCWGANDVGQLGDGTNVDRPRPVEVAGEHRFTAVNAGAGLTCGIVAGENLYCWGKVNGRVEPNPQRIPGP